jgi:hypothetical protein
VVARDLGAPSSGLSPLPRHTVRASRLGAQDVETLLGNDGNVPGIGADKGRTPSLRYADFIAPMVKAVQEQQAEITVKDQRIASLESRIAVLESKLGELDELAAQVRSLGAQRGPATSAHH